MFNPVSTIMVTAVTSYGLQKNPVAGGWLDAQEKQLEKEWSYREPHDFQPVYILGVPRSGTTILYQLLCQSPETAYFALGQLAVVDHYLLSDHWLDSLKRVVTPASRKIDDMAYDLLSPEEGVHEFLSMYNHPLFQGQHGLVAAMDMMTGQEEVALGFHKELSSFVQQLNGRIREGQPDNFLNSYQVAKFKEAVYKSVFAWRRRSRPVTTFMGKIPAASLSPRLFSYLFPNTKFIHIAREPQRVLPSFMKFAKDIQEIPLIPKKDLNDKVLASYYGLLTKSLAREVFEMDNVFHLTYEQLVQDPQATLSRLVAFVGIKEGGEAVVQAGCARLENRNLPRTQADPQAQQRIEELIAIYALEAPDHYARTVTASKIT